MRALVAGLTAALAASREEAAAEHARCGGAACVTGGAAGQGAMRGLGSLCASDVAVRARRAESEAALAQTRGAAAEALRSQLSAAHASSAAASAAHAADAEPHAAAAAEALRDALQRARAERDSMAMQLEALHSEARLSSRTPGLAPHASQAQPSGGAAQPHWAATLHLGSGAGGFGGAGGSAAAVNAAAASELAAAQAEAAVAAERLRAGLATLLARAAEAHGQIEHAAALMRSGAGAAAAGGAQGPALPPPPRTPYAYAP
jgi:hypothetical protein